tara:strand:+ start:42 stop:800 length:759 start_codon:yes stop_codon:yes gene_type:complete
MSPYKDPEKRKQCYKEYKEKNKEKIKKQNKEYWQRPENKKRKKVNEKRWREENKEKLKNYREEYYENNKEAIILTNKKWKEKNKEKVKGYKKKWERDNIEYRREYYKNNKEAIKERSRKWEKENPEKRRKRRREWYPKTYKNNIQFRLGERLRHRLYQALKGNVKNGSAVRDLGCTLEKLKVYLENQFEEGMTWENWKHDGWHIDHVKPLNSFDLTDPEQLKEACHYTNLQPLWWYDNLSKSDKIDWEREFK